VKDIKTVQRNDSVSLDKATFTPEGFLRDSPIIARTGILEYINPDGSIRREFRPSEEVFKADSLASFKGKPIVMGHGAGMISADNAKRVMIGTMLSEGIQDGENVRADLMIHDKNALDSGRRALSVGYSVDEDWTPGEYNGIKYDLVQRNIKVNHLGLVNKGRAGEQARLTLDGDQVDEYEEERKVMKIRLDNGIEYEAAPEVVAAIDAMKTDMAKIKLDGADLQRKLDVSEAKADTLQADKVKLDEQLKASDKKHADGLNEAVKQRVSLLGIATAHKLDKADEMTDRQIKEAVITAVRGDSIDLKDKSDDYIQAAFDMASADGVRNDGIAKQRKTLTDKGAGNERKDEAASSEDARQRMIERQADLYKGGNA
jgi:hypothetical protein